MRYFEGLQHFTPAETAKRLGLTRAQVYGLIRAGKLAARFHGVHVYVPRAEVERLAGELETLGGDRIAAHLLRALGVRQRLIFSWRNGHGGGAHG